MAPAMFRAVVARDRDGRRWKASRSPCRGRVGAERPRHRGQSSCCSSLRCRESFIESWSTRTASTASTCRYARQCRGLPRPGSWMWRISWTVIRVSAVRSLPPIASRYTQEAASPYPLTSLDEGVQPGGAGAAAVVPPWWMPPSSTRSRWPRSHWRGSGRLASSSRSRAPKPPQATPNRAATPPT